MRVRGSFQKLIAFIAISIIAASPGLPNAAESELLPLKHGGYVDQKIACNVGGNVNSLTYFGTAIHASKMLDSEKVLSRTGNVYRLQDSPIDVTTSRLLPPFVVTITILSSTRFTLVTPFGEATYRWCTAKMGL